MPENDKTNTVYIKRCPEYDREAIREAVLEGMKAVGYRPEGKVFAKPNAVVAHREDKMGPHGCTNRAFVHGALSALSRSPGVERIDLGEKSGVGFPTRMSYRFAGYYDEIDRLKKEEGAPVYPFAIEEEKRDPVFIGGRVHDVLRVARKMNRADTKVYFPKLKCHCVSAMTGAVKLNVGICSEDERSIRHDFLLNEKIVDLLAAGYPDFTAMDAIDVGVGNEGFPIYRRLGLILMGRNPIAVDMVGARLLDLSVPDVPYLAAALERGYGPPSIDEVEIAGDLASLADVDEAAKAIGPYDDEFFQWQDVNKELKRLGSSMRFFHGPYNSEGKLCKTGCVMGIKMYLAAFEKYAGADAFKNSKPAVFVIGRPDEEIDCNGAEAFLFGSCSKAKLKNAKKVVKIDKCFTTVTDMMIQTGGRLGMPWPLKDREYVGPMAKAVLGAGWAKLINGRYFQDMGYFAAKRLDKRL